MTGVKADLAELAAQAAYALTGYLEFLAASGVEGLPAPTLRAPAAAPKTAPQRAAAPRAATAQPVRPPPPVQQAQPPQPPPPAATPPSAPRSAAPPWARHVGAAAASKDSGTATPRPPAPRPQAQPVSPHLMSAPPARQPAPPEATAAVNLAAAHNPLGGSGAQGLQQIRDDLGDCKRCKLHASRTNLVFGVGSAAADLCFVGEGPGADEDMQGEPFVGRAGQLLTQMIKAMGMSREEVYICNVVKCRPPNNRDPDPDEVAACSPFLIRQVQAVNPRVIVALGRHAAQTMLGVKTPISRLRGTWNQWQGVPLMPTFHPSFLLRDPTQKRHAWEDLKAVLRLMDRPVPQSKKGS